MVRDSTFVSRGFPFIYFLEPFSGKGQFMLLIKSTNTSCSIDSLSLRAAMASHQTFSPRRMRSSKVMEQMALFQEMYPMGLPSRSASVFSRGEASRSRSRSSPPPAWLPFQRLRTKSQLNDVNPEGSLPSVLEETSDGPSAKRDAHSNISMWINGEMLQDGTYYDCSLISVR
jgi:hypothetical protein